MNWVKNNWFKMSIIIAIFTYLCIIVFNSYLDGKKYNLEVYKDVIDFCYDLTNGSKSSYYICRKAIGQYYLINDLFINKDLKKEYERERFYWSCYDEERNSESCSKKADESVNR